MGCIGSIVRMLVIAGTAGAIAMNVLVYFSCEFLEVKNNPGITIGLFALEVNDGGCVQYQNDGEDFKSGLLRKVVSTDSYIRTAQTGIIAAMAFGSGALFIVLVDQYLCPICCARCFESMCYVGAQVGTALAYFLYMSGYCSGGNCAWGQGATYNIIAMGLYLVASILFCCMGEKPRIARKKKNGEEPLATPETPTKDDAASQQLETGTASVATGSPNGASTAPSYESPPYATTY